jgi:acyl carrier protein
VTIVNREEPMEVRTAVTLDTVRAIVVDTLGVEDRADTLQADTPLLGSMPELDSMAVLELVLALEEGFDISIDGDDVTAEAFETLGSLAALVDGKLS